MSERTVNTLTYIIAIAVLVSLIVFFSGCKTKTVYVPVESVRYEKDIETVHDTTVLIKLVPHYTENITPKDSSYLENPYAFSFAHWDGLFLRHTLGIKDIEIPVKILYLDRWHIRTDSIRIPYPVEVEKVVNRLNSFQSFQIWCGRILLTMLLVWAIYRFIKAKYKF